MFFYQITHVIFIEKLSVSLLIFLAHRVYMICPNNLSVTFLARRDLSIFSLLQFDQMPVTVILVAAPVTKFHSDIHLLVTTLNTARMFLTHSVVLVHHPLVTPRFRTHMVATEPLIHTTIVNRTTHTFTSFNIATVVTAGLARQPHIFAVVVHALQTVTKRIYHPLYLLRTVALTYKPLRLRGVEPQLFDRPPHLTHLIAFGHVGVARFFNQVSRSASTKTYSLINESYRIKQFSIFRMEKFCDMLDHLHNILHLATFSIV